MDIIELVAKRTRESIINSTHIVSCEKEIMDSLHTLEDRSEKIIEKEREKMKCIINNTLGDAVNRQSALGKFLWEKPEMPHEKNKNYQAALVSILVDLIYSDYGKTTSGGVEQFLFEYRTAASLWESIHEDLKEILQQFFGITPFLDKSRGESYWEIGFSVDAKWPPA